jgi:hypothetical protein
VLDLTDAQDWFLWHDQPGPYKSHHVCSLYSITRSRDGAANPDAYSRPEASWRRMLVTQPAVEMLKIVYANVVRKSWSRTKEKRQLASGEGLRMGFLYDFIVGRGGLQSGSGFTFRRFSIQWNMFDIEDNLKTEEWQGNSDFLSRAALIERNEEKENVTLVVMSM